MPSTPQSCLLVKISSSQYGPVCPPVIIKEKDWSRRAQQRHQHASLLFCSERSTLSNPPAPDGPIYCTKWIVFSCTLYFQMFLWYPLCFSMPCPLWFWPAHGKNRTVWPVYSLCRTTEGLSVLRWECHIVPGWWDTSVEVLQPQNKDLQTLLSLTWCFF